MMELDPVILSRIQFAFVVSFHIIFPAFTIGLAAWLATIEGMSLATRRPIYRQVFDFWLKVFALSFGMGVVSGIVMAFQFGTNWSVLAERTGSIQGPLLGYEGFTAFMLEATFFGVVLFGRDRVPRWFYFVSCCMVAVGTMLSSFWIMCNNSWMQVPLGHTVIDGRLVPDNWWTILFGPVMLVRWPHMLLGAFLTTGMSIIATGAWYLLRGKEVPGGAGDAALGAGAGRADDAGADRVRALAGDYVHHYQPAKFAAIEARWHTEQPASEVLIGIPDPAAERNLFAVSVPKLGSFIATGTWDSKEVGLDTFPVEDRPPVLIPFLTFRLMVGMALIMLAISWFGLGCTGADGWRRRDGSSGARSWRFPTGFVAVLAGWFTAEVGRQPWVVYGLLRTKDAVTPSLATADVLFSLLAYIVVYAVIYAFGFYYVYRLLRDGPAGDAGADLPGSAMAAAAHRGVE